MSDTASFADLIDEALEHEERRTLFTDARPNRPASILAMPEMRAIREVLAEVLDSTAYGCPYLLQDGSDGAYGPNTCNQGCHDEPECMNGDYIRLPKSIRQWVRT